jgi:hypothetical protein
MKARSVSIIACALATLMFQQCSTSQSADEFINRPFDNIDVSNNTFELDASEAKTFRLPNGTSIAIPADAFADENGNPVKGKVKINYREFHDAAAIIASGIPMTYDSAGVKGKFETAGMFEIKGATAGGKPIFVAKGKGIQVNIASFAQGDDYNFYFLDPSTGTWAYRGLAAAYENAEKKAKTKAMGEAPVKPMMPEKYDGHSMVFDLDMNYKKYPEFKEFNGVVWQYAGSDPKADPAMNPAIFQQGWTDIRLKPSTEEASTFDLVLSNSTRSFTTQVRPVLKGKNYEKAMANFQERIASYNVAYAARVTEEERLRTEADLIRSFTISGFGVYNCDRIFKRDDNIIVNVRLILDGVSDKDAHRIDVYFVTASDRAVIKLSRSNPTIPVSLAESSNKLVAVLPDNKLAVCPPGEFKKIDLTSAEADGGPVVFHLKKVEKPISSVDDLKKVLDSL